MQRRRIEIRAVRPDQSVNFRIDAHLIENSQIPQRAEKFAGEDWLKIDDLFSRVVKSNTQSVGRLNLD